MRRILIYVLCFLSVSSMLKAEETSQKILQDARNALLRYDLTTAANKYSAYQAALKKLKLSPDTMAYLENSAISRLRNALGNVEDVVFIDSIVIPIKITAEDSLYNPDNKEFLQRVLTSINLPSSCGRFADASTLDFIQNPDSVTGLVFINADGTTALYSAPGPRGVNILYEADFLSNGDWEINPISDIPAPAYSPYILDDGMTLYYTSDNYTSLGRRDVMMSVRDGITAPWRQPRNLGMPFNSAGDELLFAIDTQDSIGWLLTARDSFSPDSAVLYVFMPSETRRNLDSNDAELINRARITCIADTWPEGFNPKAVLKKLKANTMPSDHHKDDADFQFILPDGKVITRLDSFTDSRALTAMNEYLQQSEKLEDAENALYALYEAFGVNNRTEANRQAILEAEINIDYLRAAVQRKKNKVLRLLGYK